MLANIFGKFFKVGIFSALGGVISIVSKFVESLVQHSTPTNSWEDVFRAALAAALAGGLAALERWKNFDPNKLGR